MARPRIYPPDRVRPTRPQGPRVNLTLTPELDRVLGRLSAASGAGKASFVREWLIEALPVLDQLATSMEQAKAGNLDVFDSLARVMREGREQFDQVEMDLTRTRRRVARKRKASGS